MRIFTTLSSRLGRLRQVGLLGALLALLPLVGVGQNALTSSALTYTQNFDGMGATGTSYVPNWTGIRYAGSGTINATLTTLTVLAANSNTGNAYNAGAITGAATGDRALGTLASAATFPAFGTSFVNNTGSAITRLDLAGFMEQWRTGDNVALERVIFEYSLNATNLNSPSTPNASTATWVPVTSFDLVEIAANNTTTAVNSLDGNAAVNRTALTAAITGLNITNGATFFIRWRDSNDLGNDGLYSVDEFSLTATTGMAPPTLTVSPTKLSGFTYVAGAGPSAAQSYDLSGSNLTPAAGNLTATAPTNYEVALTSTGTYAATQTVAYTGSTLAATPIFVRLKTGLAANSYTGNVVNSGGGAADANVALTGSVTAAATPAPTVTSFTPANGPVGTVVTITGTGFVAGTTVAFNGTAATAVTVVSATSIQATVPTGATTGTLSVSNTNGTATSSGTFTVTPPVASVVAAGLLLLEDDFNYLAGTRLNANGWAVHSGGGTNDSPTVVAGNLTKVTYPTGPLAPNANRAESVGTSADVNRGFTVPTAQNTVYYSALISIPVGGTFPDYFLHLLERTNTSGTLTQNFRAKLFAKAGPAANTFNLGVSVTSNPNETPAPSYTTTDLAEGQTYLAVVKYVYVPGGRDIAALFVFDGTTPLPAIEPATPNAVVQENNNPTFSLPNAVAIRQTSTSPLVDIDGIRVATGWATVVGNPTYTEPTATINAGNYYRLTVNGTGTQLAPVGAVNVENELVLTEGLINTTATNSLTLYPSVVVSGGSNASFVNGPLGRLTAAGAATVVFPIGKGTAYRPLTMNTTAQTSITTFTAEQIEANALGAGISDLDANGRTVLKRVSQFRYFTVTPTPTPPTGYSGTITLSFGSDDRVNFPGNGDLVVGKRDNATTLWANLGRTTSTGPAGSIGGPSVSGTLTSDVFTTFSDFTLASTDITNNVFAPLNPLPVALTSFTAQRQPAAGVQLTWSTATERNSAYFEVQRSLDGRSFRPVAKVAAQGSSARSISYASLDGTAPAAQLYYRLRQVDADGTASFSPVLSVGAGSTSLTLFPNPARTTISFRVPAEIPLPYRILNQVGQQVRRGQTSVGLTTLDVATLAAGSYLLELQTGAGRVVRRFTIID